MPSSKKSRPPGPRQKTMMVKINEIVRDRAFQVRVEGTKPDQVAGFRDSIREKRKIPKIVLWHVAGVGLILVDGWHRVEAHELEGKAEIDAVVKYGTREQAMQDALSANRTNLGLPLSTKDKRHAVAEMIKLHPRWSAKLIADAVGCGIARQTVHNIRKELEQKQEVEKVETVQGKDGREVQARKPAGVQAGGGWESVPVAEFITAKERVTLCLEAGKVVTAGDLDQALRDNRLPLRQTDLSSLWDELQQLKERCDKGPAEPVRPVPTTPPKQGASTTFSFAALDAALKVIVREFDLLCKQRPNWSREPDVRGVGRLVGDLAEVLKTLNERLLREAR